MYTLIFLSIWQADLNYTCILPKIYWFNLQKMYRWLSTFLFIPGVYRVTVSSYGLNYDGRYKEHVFLDNRQAVHSSVGYVAVKRSTRAWPTRVLLTAFDHCGRVCRPHCLIRRSYPPRYFPCTGAIKISPRGRGKVYGRTYEEAVLLRWRFRWSSVPTEVDRNVHVVFYCNGRVGRWPTSRLYRQI